MRNEIKKNQQTITSQDDEIRALKEKNLGLITSMKNELRTLLQKQQDDADLIGLLKTKVASYSTELITLQTLIREKGLADVGKLEQELQRLQLKNEELNKKIADLEKDMHDAARRAEAISAELSSEVTFGSNADGSIPSNIKEQLDAASERITRLLEWRKEAMKELHKIRVDNDELTQLLKVLDRRLKDMQKQQSGSNGTSSSSKDDNYLATYEQTNSEVAMNLTDVIAWTTARFDSLKDRIDKMQVPQ